ncbi:DUF4229 domain-containing protein [uncultured Georgenia sp.]|uniref:DUF4229 domain-containing protein n=1 Tax=uncultured Georgenia sp. TaxID=378209 RepID=UPI00261BF552|nr:DUF4229 domain-containing protein [uncultured Georgenia sp.]HLV04835.1 DUF4229 domain-containing protein [Actinomycetaceae bacterium]
MPIVRYTLLRLAVLAVVLGLLWLVGVRGWLLPLLAVVVAALVSFLVLPKQAGEAAQVLARKRERKPVEDAIAQDAAEEDALLDGEDDTPGRREG